MSGYNRQKCMSNNAVAAYEDGLLPKSKLKAWQKRAVETGAVMKAEWHHTGKFYSETDFYDPADFEGLNPKDFPVIKKEKLEENKWYVLVSAEWGGTKSHPKITGADVKVTKHITERQRTAKKYFRYGGNIKEFASELEARVFADGAKLDVLGVEKFI